MKTSFVCYSPAVTDSTDGVDVFPFFVTLRNKTEFTIMVKRLVLINNSNITIKFRYIPVEPLLRRSVVAAKTPRTS